MWTHSRFYTRHPLNLWHRKFAEHHDSAEGRYAAQIKSLKCYAERHPWAQKPSSHSLDFGEALTSDYNFWKKHLFTDDWHKDKLTIWYKELLIWLKLQKNTSVRSVLNSASEKFSKNWVPHLQAQLQYARIECLRVWRLPSLPRLFLQLPGRIGQFFWCSSVSGWWWCSILVGKKHLQTTCGDSVAIFPSEESTVRSRSSLRASHHPTQ